MVYYRTFRNTDPPGVVEVWNDGFTGRGAVRLRTSTPLEHHVFAKPYFDPKGLIVALEGGEPAGFAHAAFGSNDIETAIDSTQGVTCCIGVRPAFRRRGIGTELLRRCEAYLRERGTQNLHMGVTRPVDPFYFGL